VIKHLSEDNSLILDDFDSESADAREHEANILARDAVVPLEIWEEHKVTKIKTPKKELVIDLASRMEVHPALIAGRVRYERGRYDIFSSLVGNGEVRKLFS
jgi:HTH-type transcriptional regulator/antitoxin HigA